MLYFVTYMWNLKKKKKKNKHKKKEIVIDTENKQEAARGER